jgi:hypothetical protein
MKQIVAISLTIAIASSLGCSSKPIPQCAKQPDSSKLSSAELAALKDALARFGERCKRQETQCEINLTHNTKDQILVSVASVYPHQESGQCLQAPGDQDLAVYSSAGEFIETVMSL